jgi:enoyl-CoA hydratase/carnithine racemase
MTEPVLVGSEGYVQIWTINLPKERNPISSAEVVSRFEELVHAVERNYAVRAVVLTGAGSAFSSGGNVHDMHRRTSNFAGPPHILQESYRTGIQRLTKSVYYCEVPIIAAVNGAAIGAGCDLAMMCDLRIASETACFAESFVKLGIVPGDGGAWLLSRMLGAARAAEMALTGDSVDARTALAWGLVSKVLPPEELMPAALRIAGRIAENPPYAVRMTKRLLRQAQTHSLEGILELSAAMQAIAHHTEDHREALDAFMVKRAPEFTGR